MIKITEKSPSFFPNDELPNYIEFNVNNVEGTVTAFYKKLHQR